ncbi:MAG: biotin--[acetyl-CoA-carboxylase] ligase [Nitrospiraceae bacterium]|nr:MAG: biotin--[acetyl-CoA-carboxylase] ligase [Nitrospiraceae bacterium]
MSEMFTGKDVTSVYQGEFVGREIIFLDSTTSTNDRALEIGQQRPEPGGIVVVADSQTSGRGRLGRVWISPPGVNLYFTILLNPPLPVQEASALSLAAPVAAASAIRDFAGLEATIKWPNDILLSGKKAGGILIEAKPREGGRSLFAVGMGINVNMRPGELPPEIAGLATSLMAEKGAALDRRGLLGALLASMEKTYKFLLQGNKRGLITEWIRLNSTLGRRVIVRDGKRTISGTAEGITGQGELSLRISSGEIETIRTGDVTILK